MSIDYRRIDLLVAEKLMGIHPFDVREGFVRCYSVNIADAWHVVEKMTKEWPDYSISTDGNGWMVSWGFDGYGWPDVAAETAPLAICLAALKACEVEVG